MKKDDMIDTIDELQKFLLTVTATSGEIYSSESLKDAIPGINRDLKFIKQWIIKTKNLIEELGK